MTKEVDLFKVPEGLPAPSDDGAADHLVGRELPDIALASTSGDLINLSSVRGRSVIFCYPMTGRPGEQLPDGWDQIPGARGCTPQACRYRDNYEQFTKADVKVFGVSTQSPADQAEAATRLELPYPLLSDENLKLQKALDLPVFLAGGKIRIRRLTIAAENAVIQRVWYPIFPSDSDVPAVLEWIR